MLSTPILLITFNRPQHTRKVLERILEANPQELYIFQDGAREGNHTDQTQCEAVRRVVEELTTDYNRNHPLHLHTLYESQNLGCGPGPAKAISWFFSEVEEGIVMEDDCLAHPDFFPYCEELLNRYRSDHRIGFINATLYDARWHTEQGASYGFSHYMVTGAWAAWRRTWEGFDLDLLQMKATALKHQIYQLTHNRQEAYWWYFALKEMQQDTSKKSYWDFQMQIHLFMQSAITIHPAVNLISNIGFDEHGTHTLGNDGRGERPTFPILPLTHPSIIQVNEKQDAYCWAKTESKGFFRDMVDNLYNHLLWSNGFGHWLLKQYKRLKGSGYNVHRV